MFEASGSILFLDYFVVPYQVDRDGPAPRVAMVSGSVDSWTWVCASEHPSPRAIVWPSVADDPSLAMTPPTLCSLNGIPLYCPVVPDHLLRARLNDMPGRWEPVYPVYGAGETHMASVWRDGDGNLVLPFNPDQAIVSFWSEAYLHASGGGVVAVGRRLAMAAYYRLRPVMPRAMQLRLRRAFSVVQARSRFPSWPMETALHDLYDFLFERLAEVADSPVPYIAPWPHGFAWACVLTHDVETQVGYRHLPVIRKIEEQLGLHSCWNFVPARDYQVDDELVCDLWEQGHEVGVHGLHHDGRDLESRDVLEKRLPAMRLAAKRWGASGFRSPATHREWELMPLLGFDYDSSYFDTDPFEPQSGGSLSLLPFWIGDLVELPMTLTMDSTLFLILQREDESAWVEKARMIRERGGMALINTHPDYLISPHLTDVYSRFLGWVAADETAWHALPGEVSEWWRRRTASHLVRRGDEWRVEGAAEHDGRIRFAGVPSATQTPSPVA